MNVAIITARAGSKSISNKNIIQVGGHPLISYPIRAAQAAPSIAEVFVDTDGESIAEVARSLGCGILKRPEELAGDHVNHGDVIKHAVERADERVSGLANVVLLLGNTVMIDGPLIEQCLGKLEQDPSLDSVMTVWEAADDHPLRALRIDEDGMLAAYGDSPRAVSTERQSYPPAYYYDQGVWAFRKECVRTRQGPNPWWWMGKRCLPIVRPWITGRDINGPYDVPFHEWWVTGRAQAPR